jgi:hypothetical protein
MAAAFGLVWSSSCSALAPMRSNTRTVRWTLSALPKPLSASTTMGSRDAVADRGERVGHLAHRDEADVGPAEARIGDGRAGQIDGLGAGLFRDQTPSGRRRRRARAGYAPRQAVVSGGVHAPASFALRREALLQMRHQPAIGEHRLRLSGSGSSRSPRRCSGSSSARPRHRGARLAVRHRAQVDAVSTGRPRLMALR